MCNFYSRHKDPRRLEIELEVDEQTLPNLQPVYVMRPTDTTHVVAVGREGKRKFVPMRWGLVPWWSNDVKTGLTMFNARSESIMEKRAFSEPFIKGHRCLVPVDGFFEFSGPRGGKQPHYFKPKDDRVMTFAGLWETWRGPKGGEPLPEPLLSYTIATCAPNAVVEPIHDRMPVLLTEKRHWDLWLSKDTAPEEVMKLLRPVPDDLLETFKATRDLLRVKEPGPELLDPIQ